MGAVERPKFPLDVLHLPSESRRRHQRLEPLARSGGDSDFREVITDVREWLCPTASFSAARWVSVREIVSGQSRFHEENLIVKDSIGHLMWSSLGGAPFVTVSSRGLKNGLARTPNNGADFGPDSDTTGTSGIQDALNSISAGGMVYIYGEGTAAEYSLTQALHNTGNQQVVWFEPDVYLLNAISQGSSGDGASIIFAFSNATYKSGGPQGAPTAAYSNCY